MANTLVLLQYCEVQANTTCISTESCLKLLYLCWHNISLLRWCCPSYSWITPQLISRGRFAFPSKMETTVLALLRGSRTVTLSYEGLSYWLGISLVGQPTTMRFRSLLGLMSFNTSCMLAFTQTSAYCKYGLGCPLNT